MPKSIDIPALMEREQKYRAMNVSYESMFPDWDEPDFSDKECRRKYKTTPMETLIAAYITLVKDN